MIRNGAEETRLSRVGDNAVDNSHVQWQTILR